MSEEVAGIILTAVTVLLGWMSLLIKRNKSKIETDEAEAADKKADADTQELLNEQFRVLRDEFKEVKDQHLKTAAERDAAIEESKAYQIALDQSAAKLQALEVRQETLQNEIKTMKSENAGLKKTVEKLQSDLTDFEEKLNREVADKTKLAAELKDAKTTINNMEKIAAEREQAHALAVTRLTAKLEVYENTNNKLLAKIQPMASESSEKVPEAAEPNGTQVDTKREQ